MVNVEEQITQFDLEYQLQHLGEQVDQIPDEETNVLSILGIRSRERRLTRFLRWVLDPEASHDTGRLFLDRFLDECALQLHGDISVDALIPIKTDEEQDDAELDLVLTGADQVIGVEIKTTHQGQDQKLEKEEEALPLKYPGYDSYELVYLTYFGRGRPKTNHEQVFWNQLIDRIEADVEKVPAEFEKRLINNFIETIRTHVMTELHEISKETELYLEYQEAVDDVKDAYEKDRDRAYKALREAFFSLSDVEEDDWKVSNRSDRYIKFYKEEWKGIGDGVNLEFEPHIHLEVPDITLRLDIEHGNSEEVRASFRDRLSDEDQQEIIDEGWEFTDGSYSFLAKSIQLDLEDNPQESIEYAAEELHQLRKIVEPHLDAVAAEY